TNQFEPDYAIRLQEWIDAGISDAADTVIINAADIKRHSEGSLHKVGDHAGAENVLIWHNEASHWIEYEVDITSPGLYEFSLDYHSFIDESASRNYRPTIMAVQI